MLCVYLLDCEYLDSSANESKTVAYKISFGKESRSFRCNASRLHERRHDFVIGEAASAANDCSLTITVNKQSTYQMFLSTIKAVCVEPDVLVDFAFAATGAAGVALRVALEMRSSASPLDEALLLFNMLVTGTQQVPAAGCALRQSSPPRASSVNLAALLSDSLTTEEGDEYGAVDADLEGDEESGDETTGYIEEASMSSSEDEVDSRPSRSLTDFSFNKRWQEIDERARSLGISSSKAELIKVNKDLSELMIDFVSSARDYGAIIIRELHLPDFQKSIKPLDVGGVLGGTKFCTYEGIFFKLCVDKDGRLFGDDNGLIYPPHKVGGHELKSATTLHNLRGLPLSLPLITIIDFMGHRLVAAAAIELTDFSMCLGSADAGKTVLNSDPILSEAAKLAGQQLNLAPHLVRDSDVIVSLAVDIEGHVCPSDGRRYLVDLSRLMPPATPNARRTRRSAHLYRLLRSELVQSVSKDPLCSDAYSSFLTKSDRRATHTAIKRATEILKNRVIPETALVIDRLNFGKEGSRHSLSHLQRVMHVVGVHGVNKRHLGRVRRFCRLPISNQLICIEIVSRCFKQLVRSEWRKTLQTSSRTFPFIGLLVSLCNNLFRKNDALWQRITHNAKDYFHERSTVTSDSLFRLVTSVRGGLSLLLRRVSQFLGVLWSSRILISLEAVDVVVSKGTFGRKSDTQRVIPFELQNTLLFVDDVEQLLPTVKQSGAASIAQGYIQYQLGSVRSGETKRHYLKKSQQYFSDALVNNPSDTFSLRYLAKVNQNLFSAVYDMKRGYLLNPKIRYIDSLYLYSLKGDPHDPLTLYHRAVFLDICDIDVDKVITLLCKALTISPQLQKAYLMLQRVLEKLGVDITPFSAWQQKAE